MIHSFSNSPGLRRAIVYGVVGLAMAAPNASRADEICDISSDVGYYFERVEQAILLMQYQDIVLRAVDGNIHCQEDAPSERQVCLVDGPDEVLIASDRGQFAVRLNGPEQNAVHIYATGDLSCGLAADME